jgi:hypothetical protein
MSYGLAWHSVVSDTFTSFPSSMARRKRPGLLGGCSGHHGRSVGAHVIAP